MIDNIISELTRDEGFKLKPYRDQVGKLTIGIGRNLDDCGITPDEAMYLLRNDIKKVTDGLTVMYPWFVVLTAPRQAVVVDMAFNLGLAGFVKFKQTILDIEHGDYPKAAADMAQSLWARQVGSRSIRLCEQLKTGVWAQ